LPRAITAERKPDGLKIGAELQRKRTDDRGISCVCVGCRISFVVAQKDLAEATIGKSADGRCIFQAGCLEFESLSKSSVWQAFTRHGRAFHYAGSGVNELVKQGRAKVCAPMKEFECRHGDEIGVAAVIASVTSR
jgi:hypothetical protein